MKPLRRTPLAADALDGTDRVLINRMQDGLPLVPHPFAALATDLGLEEDALIARIQAMREIGAITRFGPFFDAEAMGGAFCLCAMEVPSNRFDAVMTLVNAHPQVAHNYERTHRLNMWFVLACERAAQIKQTAEQIERETGFPVLLFPKEHEFFIGFKVTA
jgi:DNA-binding Lrp family transcriptional regulator